MHISPERYIRTLQYPFAPPLPLLTCGGARPVQWDGRALATYSGRVFDASATAVFRLMATPLLTAGGAGRRGFCGLSCKSMQALPLACAGALVGAVLGSLGALVSVGDALLSAGALVLVFVYIVGYALALGARQLLWALAARHSEAAMPHLDAP